MSDKTMQTLQHLLKIQSPSPILCMQTDWPGASNYQIDLKRDDLLHPIISGNKWRKLKYALLQGQQNHLKHIVSFGGGYSNHLHALGYCCGKMKLRFSAIIRGDYSANPSPMLQDLKAWGSELHYVERSIYKLRDQPEYLAKLQGQYPKATIIPEGGSQALALRGVGEIIHELTEDYDYILAPVGSGGTLAGLINQRPGNTKIIGIAVLKGKDYLENLVSDLLPAPAQDKSNWQINHHYHMGGYGKSNHELNTFCKTFGQQTAIAIEPVYSGKLLFALKDLVAKKAFPSGSKILVIHTGGLQGAR